MEINKFQIYFFKEIKKRKFVNRNNRINRKNIYIYFINKTNCEY